jgi:DNA invertase Pin-like site-specific DNA recombinase
MFIMDNLKQKPKAALYSRVASSGTEDDRVIDIQCERLCRFAEQQGFAEYIIYRDNGFSGNNFNRPAFVQMEADIQSGKVDTVIVRSIDRIALDIFLCNKWISGLSKYGVKLIAVNGSHEHYAMFNNIYSSLVGVV